MVESRGFLKPVAVQRAEYDLEWDPVKARANERKHGISFERAATVLLDPRALSIFDEKHSEEEKRWITLGLDQSGVMLAVRHTFKTASKNRATVRIISARKATRTEVRQYGEKP